MAQTQISPEWSNWIQENLANGCLLDILVKVMVEKGFVREIARQAVLNVKEGRDANFDLNVSSNGYTYEKPRIPVDVNYIDTHDRRVFIASKLSKPTVVVFDSLMSAEECDQLIALSHGKMQQSKVVDEVTGQETLHDERTSLGTFFRFCETDFIAMLDRRIAEVMHWPAENGEGLQILNYKPGGEYKPHFDYFPYDQAGSKRHLAVGGQRVSTLVIYLNDVDQGGETDFPEIGLSVVPKKGSGVYFEYCNSKGEIDPQTLHAGLPVVKGEKWIATKWMRQRRYS